LPQDESSTSATKCKASDLILTSQVRFFPSISHGSSHDVHHPSSNHDKQVLQQRLHRLFEIHGAWIIKSIISFMYLSHLFDWLNTSNFKTELPHVTGKKHFVVCETC